VALSVTCSSAVAFVSTAGCTPVPVNRESNERPIAGLGLGLGLPPGDGLADGLGLGLGLPPGDGLADGLGLGLGPVIPLKMPTRRFALFCRIAIFEPATITGTV